MILLWLIGHTLFAQSDTAVVMRIDGVAVSRSEYLFYVDRVCHAAEDERPLADYIDDFIAFKLDVAEAKALHMDTLAAFRRRVEAYRNRLADACFSGADLPAYGPSLHLKQLLIRLPQNASPQTLRAGKALSDSLYANLQRRPSDFDAYVQRYSDDKDEHWLHRLQMTEEMEAVAFTLPDGQLSSPFYSPLGIHILQVLGRGVPPETLRRLEKQCPTFPLSLQLYEGYNLALAYYRTTVLEAMDETGLAAFFSCQAAVYQAEARRQNKEKPQSYRDVYPQIVQDYAAWLHRRQQQQLRLKAKVEINQEVLKTVNKHEEQ
ncbi:MAG: peptidyl-prolyl cis-trans isomerase [Prevotellaceae bacterium]|jgi:hypothetical protein|nr:peptidyl-prolyl cis-trans isomerase [Prevotellaceae bacterium]